MKKPDLSYPGNDVVRRFLVNYRCPAPFHVVRMRFWGEIVSPSFDASPVKTIQSLWPEGLPRFESADETKRFYQVLLSLWNRMARFQSGSPPLKLQQVGCVDTRETLHDAANLRVDELHDGFMYGFTCGNKHVDVPPGISDLLIGVEKAIELFATARNTFARPPGRDDAAMLSELTKAFPVVDQAVQSSLNAIAVTVMEWRKGSIPRMAAEGKKASLH